MYGSSRQYAEQYRHVGVSSAVAEANPHKLVALLLSGALDRLRLASASLERGDQARKGKAIGEVCAIVGHLNGSLDHQAGGEIPEYRAEAQAQYPALGAAAGQRRLLYESIRRMLSAQVYDVIDATQAALASQAPADIQAVRLAPALVMFGDAMRERSLELKRFLFKNLYRHPRVMETTARAQEVVRDLFAAYTAAPHEMNAGFAELAAADRGPVRARAVADFIAGMTDRFAAREHERLMGRRLFD